LGRLAQIGRAAARGSLRSICSARRRDIPRPAPQSAQRNRIFALPFCHLTLKAKKPVSREKYPDILRTWGDHLKTRRLDLKLTKRQLSINLTEQ